MSYENEDLNDIKDIINIAIYLHNTYLIAHLKDASKEIFHWPSIKKIKNTLFELNERIKILEEKENILSYDEKDEERGYLQTEYEEPSYDPEHCYLCDASVYECICAEIAAYELNELED